MVISAVLISFLAAQEERIDDADYDRQASVHVKAVETIEKTWRKDPAAALRAIDPVIRAIEAELLPRLPQLVETTIAVRVTRGIDKGEIRERHPFFPYRLAGEIALAAGEPERAVERLQKSPGSVALLAEARKAAAARGKKDPVPPPAKAGPDLRPFLERHDFIAALEALRTSPETPAAERERLAGEVRREAAAFQKERVAALAAALPRFEEEDFRKEHLEPCLRACARVPADLESEELRWIRRLDHWADGRDAAELERLAIAALRFGADFQILCDRAQDRRLRNLGRLVEELNRAEGRERPALLDRIGQDERALASLLAARDRSGVREELAALKAKLPIDDESLQRARAGSYAIADIRRLADELERLWLSERRARLSTPDQRDLALRLGVYRSLSLFLDGRTVDEVAKDARISEVFRVPGELPPDVSPKVAAVRARIR